MSAIGDPMSISKNANGTNNIFCDLRGPFTISTEPLGVHGPPIDQESILPSFLNLPFRVALKFVLIWWNTLYSTYFGYNEMHIR